LLISQISQYKHPENDSIIVVRLETSDGVVGVGDVVCSNDVDAVSMKIDEIANALVGSDLFAIEKWFYALVTTNMPEGGNVLVSAASAVEMAVWDAIAKTIDLPLHKLLGGKVQQPLNMTNPSQSYKIYEEKTKSKSNDTLLNPIGICLSGWDDGCIEVEEYAVAAKKATEAGFWALSFSPLTEASINNLNQKRIDTAQAVEIVAAVREAVGENVEIYVDVTKTMDFDQAAWFCRQMEKLSVNLVRSPIKSDETSDYLKLIRLTSVPVSRGGSPKLLRNCMKYFEEKASSAITVDLMLCGGIHELRKILAAAECFYMKCDLIGGKAPAAFFAAAHAAVTVNSGDRIEMDISIPRLIKDYYGGEVIIQGGNLLLSDKLPGLGINIDFTKLEPVGKKG